MAEQLLYVPDVISILQQAGGKRTAKRLAGGPFGDSGLGNGMFEQLLQDGFIQVVPAFFAGLIILPPVLPRKHPMPAPPSGRQDIDDPVQKAEVRSPSRRQGPFYESA